MAGSLAKQFEDNGCWLAWESRPDQPGMACEVIFERDGLTWVIILATAEYLAYIHERDKRLPPELSEDDQALVVSDFSDVAMICQDLRADLPLAVIQQYATMQLEVPPV